jgi:Integral peroxisomal membrane peroxin
VSNSSRIGVAFVFQARATRLFSWRTTSHTLSFLAIYSFVCVYPFLLPIVPLCLILLFVMVPAYLARHPPPPTDSSGGAGTYLSGPALAPPRVVKPAPEMSHDFFRNMRDIQNSMADFTILHDTILRILTPWTNFADEAKSSAAFLSMTVTAVALLLVAPILPWRAVALIGGWVLIGSNHPRVQAWLKPLDAERGAPARQAAGSSVQRWIRTDFALDDPPEILEVEIFELQRRRMPSSLINPSNNFSFPSPTSSSSFATHAAPESEYEAWLFSPTPWEPQAPARRAGDRPKGSRFFEDVQPPQGWTWASKKWVLDLGVEGVGEDWVGARMLRGLEVEREGERWVYDLVDGNDLGEIYDEYRGGGRGKGGRPKEGDKTPASSRSTLKKQQQGLPNPSEDYSEKEAAVVFRGEWRRRRWVRSVKRAKVHGSGVKVVSDASGGPAR